MAPPLTYAILIVTTVVVAAAAWPWIPSGRPRRFAAAMFGSLAVLEAALIVLYYSKLACGLIAAGGAAMPAWLLWGRGRRLVAGYIGVLGLVLGLAFTLAPEEQTFVVYFGTSLPVLYGLAFASGCAHDAALGPRTRGLVVLAPLFLFAALIPFSAFSISFLQLFELAHALPNLLALASIVAYSVRAAPAAQRVRQDVASSGSLVDAFDVLPHRSSVPWPILVALALATILTWRPWSFLGALWPGVAALLVVGGLLLVGRRAPAGSWQASAGAAVGLAGAFLGHYPSVARLAAGQGSDMALPFWVAVGGAVGLAWSLLLAHELQRTRQDALRNDWLDAWRGSTLKASPREIRSLPAERWRGWPTVADLTRAAHRLGAEGAPGLVLRVRPERPLDTLGEEAERFLREQDPTRPRVFVAVEEGRDVFLIPSIQPEGDPR